MTKMVSMSSLDSMRLLQRICAEGVSWRSFDDGGDNEGEETDEEGGGVIEITSSGI